MNAVATAIERAGVQPALPKSLRDASPVTAPEAESTLSIEALQARAETVTAVLEDILRSESTGDWRN